MKVLIIGGNGHIGSYLVPRLISKGIKVSVVGRKSQPRYANPDLFWKQVDWVIADRRKEEENGQWQDRIADLVADVVIDLICFTPQQNRIMMDAFRGRIQHFLHCGTIWAYGPSEIKPYMEHFARSPITDYGRMKAEIERDLLTAYRMDGFPATLIHPGHICGRKWLPIDPQGKIEGVKIYRDLATGEKVYLPDDGLANLNHVHADDVAQLFELAIFHRQQALGESFSAVAPYAMSLRALCNYVASIFGEKANLRYFPMAKLKEKMSESAYNGTYIHAIHSSCCSIAKAQGLLGYQPRYTPEEIFQECIEYMLESGQLKI